MQPQTHHSNLDAGGEFDANARESVTYVEWLDFPLLPSRLGASRSLGRTYRRRFARSRVRHRGAEGPPA
jgi:hypothetical protein